MRTQVPQPGGALDSIIGAIAMIAPIAKWLRSKGWAIRFLRRLNVDLANVPPEFGTIYAQAIEDYRGKRGSLGAELFKQKAVTKAARLSCARRDRNILHEKAKKYLEVFEIGDKWRGAELELDSELSIFWECFDSVADLSTSPAEARRDGKINEMHRWLEEMHDHNRSGFAGLPNNFSKPVPRSHGASYAPPDYIGNTSLRPTSTTTDQYQAGRDSNATTAELRIVSEKIDVLLSAFLAGSHAEGTSSTDASLAGALARAGYVHRGPDHTTGLGVCPLPREAGEQISRRESDSQAAKGIRAASRERSPQHEGPALDSGLSGTTEPVLVDLRVATTRRVDMLALTTQIQAHLGVWDFDKALSLAEILESSLDAEKSASKDLVASLLFLLGRVHVNRAETKSEDFEKHVARAEALISQARTLNPPSELADDMSVLDASIENVKNGPDAALRLLEGKTSPYATRIRLAMLLNLQRVEDARQEIQDIVFHERWCDLGTTVFAASGDTQKAKDLMNWAAGLQDKVQYPQCVVRFADATLARTLKNHAAGQNICPHDISESEAERLKEILDILGPVLAPILAARKADSELAATAVRIAWQINHLLERRGAVADLTNLMYARTPVPLDVGRSVVSGYIPPPEDLPSRLRDEHPSNLDAHILAAVIQSGVMGQHSEAFAAAKKLTTMADTPEKKEALAKLLQQIWQELEGDEASECQAIVPLLVADNARWLAMFQASKFLRENKFDEAIGVLDKSPARDDIYWLQLYGNALFASKRTAEAVDYFLAAANKTGDPTLYHKTADLASQSGRIDTAVSCYEHLVVLQPDNVIARSNLANLCAFKLRNLERAVAQFRELRRIDSENRDHGLNLAICLAQLYRHEESLRVYNEICAMEPPDIRAVLGRAQLLEGLGRPAQAFETLRPFEDDLSGDRGFLVAFWRLAVATNHDELAHEAFLKLNALREEGEVDEKLFRMVNTEEVKEMFKKQLKQAEDRKKTLHSEMLKGRMPWLWAEDVSGNTSYQGWRNRTRPFDWIYDDPINRTSYCIYATNGFHTRMAEREVRELLPIECPPRNTMVVVDLSDLLTMHRLGVLSRALDYFGEVLVPAAYLPHVLEEGSKLSPHQLSQKTAAEAIEAKIRTKELSVLDSANAAQEREIQYVNEYEPDEKPGQFYHLRDVLVPLFDAGKISKQEYDRLSRLAAKPATADADHPSLALGQDVLFDLSTLETLTNHGLLARLTENFVVSVLREAEEEIVARLRALEIQEETRQWHMDLWDTLRQDDRVKFVPHKIPEGIKIEDEDQKDDTAFAAVFLARTEKLPLLADDRVAQMFLLTENAEVACAGFGTDKLIEALFETGILNSAQLSDCFLKLMAWRYRFILPPAQVLVELAKQYADHPPGQPLRDIARYVHDCMRDPGLFGGFEATDQPSSMAVRLFLSWLSTIADFLMDVWCDPDFRAGKAKDLTDWVISKLLPAPPRVIQGLQKVRLCEMISRYVISQAMMSSLDKKNENGVEDGLDAIRKALGLDEKQYLDIVTGVLDAF